MLLTRLFPRMLPRKLVFAILAASWYAAHRRGATRRSDGRSRAKPSHLQTWEAEGGGVPVGGSRTAQQVQPTRAQGL